MALALTTQYIVSAQALPVGPFTLSGWGQVRDTAITDRVFIGSGTAGAPALRWDATNKRAVLYQIGGSDIVASPAYSWRPFDWRHVTATHDGTTAKIYINGSLVAWAADSTTFTTATVRVGSDATLSFSGRLDDIAVFARALTAKEVDHAFYARTYPPDALFLDYRFDDPLAASIVDLSGRSNHGTINGSLAITNWSSSSYSTPRFLDRDMGLCLRLNGTDEGITLPGTVTQALGDASGFTLLAWARPLDMVSTSRRLFSVLSNTGNAGALIQTTPSAGDFVWETFARSQGSDATESTLARREERPFPGRWQHVAHVSDFAALVCETTVNGVTSIADKALAWSRASWLGSTQGGHIGQAAAANWWNGDIDEVMIYRRALTRAERSRGYLTGSLAR
ncbi:MAG: LamG domain-containing protein [Burkholderiales bacterium]|nr:LamG domain-containing protein [Burkholderiales bacterium]